jgi:nucleotide-binding universal stress UspA family protein
VEADYARIPVADGGPNIPPMAGQPKNILVGFDGSEASQRALDTAADLVGYGSTLVVVHVRRAGAPHGAVDVAREHLLQRHVSARYLEPCGAPAREIVEAARAVDADLIVVGRRSALRRVLGSVSEAVVQRAPCDVLVVH